MLIALLTDFGTQDYYVGAMKGVMLGINPRAAIVDITHEIEPQNIQSAAFVLRACYRGFPAGTIFLAVVDPGVGSQRRGIIVESGGYFFVGPDNGLFSFVIDAESTVCSIENDDFFRKPVSTTFHGRDIFAPVAAHLSNGRVGIEFGPRITDPVVLADTKPAQTGPDEFEARIIYVDRFGNLVTNVTADYASRAFELTIGAGRITELRDHYEGGTQGVPFAIVGSAGFVEISVNGGSAAEVLEAKMGTLVTVRIK